MPLLWGCQKTPFIFMVIKTPFLSGLLFQLLLKFSATKLLYPCNGYVTSLEVWHIIETVLLAEVLLTTLKQFLRSECGSSKNTLQMFCLAVIWHGFSFFCTRLHLFTWENRITEVCVFWGFFFAYIRIGWVLQISSVSWFEGWYGQLSTLLYCLLFINIERYLTD